MKKEIIENILQQTKDFDMKTQTLISKDILKQFCDYFTNENQGPLNEKIISDESLFRDYSRLGERKVDFERVRNPFNLSKFTISSYEKTWYIQQANNEIEGPFNSYEMDNLFKKGQIQKHTKIGINKIEFFRFDYFVEIVYPLPRVKGHTANSTYNKIKNVGFQNKFDNISNIQDSNTKADAQQMEKDNNKTFQNDSVSSTPFKRTPFKVMPNEIFKEETIIRENLTTDNSKWLGWSTSKKTNINQNFVQLVGESFMVKSNTKNKNKYLPRSSKDQFKMEINNDILGNYTAIKRDKDNRQYVDLSKKIEFQVKNNTEVIKEIEEPEGNIDDFDFDKIEFSKKD